jgi:hypothetical protein
VDDHTQPIHQRGITGSGIGADGSVSTLGHRAILARYQPDSCGGRRYW